MKNRTAIALSILAGLAGAANAQTACANGEPGRTLIFLDQNTIQPGFSTVEQAAIDCGVEPDVLVNGSSPQELGNDPFYWNVFCPGGQYWIPAGQSGGGEGVFVIDGTTALDLNAFVGGTIPQQFLDQILGVSALDDAGLAQLVGRSVAAIVYNGDVGINLVTQPNGDFINVANLQGARNGVFFFTVVDFREIGLLPESQSSSSLGELLIRIDPVPAAYCFNLFDGTGGGPGPGDPCPADLTGDGVADLADILAYIDLFVAGCP